MDEDPWILHARQSANCEFLKEFMNSQLLNDIKHTTTLLGTSATTHASTTTNALATATASTSATTREVIHTRVYRESSETAFLRALTSGFSDLPEENTDDEIEISEGLLLILFYFLL